MKAYLVGSTGRMGKEISAALEKQGHKLIQGFSSKDKLAFTSKADVVIDFSTADLFTSVVKASIEKKIPLVSGTTGLKDKDFKLLKEASKSIPVLWAANTSLGIQVLKNLIANLAPLKDWDFHIVESHHIHKKDAPSGTAIVLKQAVETAIDKKIPDCSAIRGGGIFGEHTIHIMGPSETITLQHTALSRAVFAEGAVAAAEFLHKQKKGLYSMQDVLDA